MTPKRQPPVVFRVPPSGALFGPELLELSGLELLRMWVEDRLPQTPIMKLSGLTASDVGLGSCAMSMPTSPWWQSASGVFLAGTLAFMADAPLSGAIMTAAGPGIGMTTSEIAIDFLRPATIRSGTIIGRGNLIHSTRSQGLSEVFLEDGRGRLLAHGTSRGILFPLGRESLPTPPVGLDSPDGPGAYKMKVEGDILGQEYWNTHEGAAILEDWISGKFRPPVSQLTGMSFTDYADGSATATMPASRWFAQGYGAVYGGALALLADFALNGALMSNLPAATSFAPLDLKLNYLRPAMPDGSVLTAHAEVEHRGRTVAVVRCEIRNAQGKPVVIGGETILILPGRPWQRPIYVADEVAFRAPVGQEAH